MTASSVDAASLYANITEPEPDIRATSKLYNVLDAPIFTEVSASTELLLQSLCL